jgi:hypothetical protein
MASKTADRIRIDLEDRGVPGNFSRPLAERLASCDLSSEAYEGFLTGAAVAYTVHEEGLVGLKKTAGDLGEIQRLMTSFSTELRKLDEALEVLAAYVVRMRTQTDGKDYTVH